ncbi:MAG TPA: hypothetical protein VNL71_23910 [Chloroflexota bacterium]|nr:hypothetical protein [Chloroflexota bacterium]
MTEVSLADAHYEVAEEQAAEELHSEDHLAARCMFLKDYDLLDIDHGHFWYKLSWHGVHVEFPSPQHHYEANPHERQIRDSLLSLPVDVLERAHQALGDAPEHVLEYGDHRFTLIWDDEIQRHLHCYYSRSEAGNQKDRDAYQSRLQDHASRYENGRQFPSKRLLQKLSWLREERAKAKQTLDAWDRLIVQVEEQIALDEIVHTGAVGSAARA